MPAYQPGRLRLLNNQLKTNVASPITGASFDNQHLSDSLCSSFQEKLLNNDKMKSLLEYLFDSSGNPASTFATDLIGLAMPVGFILAAPCDLGLDTDMFLKCEGQQVLKATYARLFAVYGTLFNRSGDSNTDTYFRIPDMRSRFFAGSGTGFSSATDITNHTEPNIGASTATTGGAKEDLITLLKAQIPPHQHLIGVGGGNLPGNVEGKLTNGPTYQEITSNGHALTADGAFLGGHAGTDADPVTKVTVPTVPPALFGIFYCKANYKLAGHIL